MLMSFFGPRIHYICDIRCVHCNAVMFFHMNIFIGFFSGVFITFFTQVLKMIIFCCLVGIGFIGCVMHVLDLIIFFTVKYEYWCILSWHGVYHFWDTRPVQADKMRFFIWILKYFILLSTNPLTFSLYIKTKYIEFVSIPMHDFTR